LPSLLCAVFVKLSFRRFYNRRQIVMYANRELLQELSYVGVAIWRHKVSFDGMRFEANEIPYPVPMKPVSSNTANTAGLAPSVPAGSATPQQAPGMVGRLANFLAAVVSPFGTPPPVNLPDANSNVARTAAPISSPSS